MYFNNFSLSYSINKCRFYLYIILYSKKSFPNFWKCINDVI